MLLSKMILGHTVINNVTVSLDCMHKNISSNGVGSYSVLGGTLHYQDTISMEKLIFLLSATKTGGTSPPWFLC